MPRRIVRPLGPWSSIIVPVLVNDGSHLTLAKAGQPAVPHEWPLLPPGEESSGIWWWQHHLCVAVIQSVINRHVSVPQQFWNIPLRCGSQQNIRTQLLILQNICLRNESQVYQGISSPPPQDLAPGSPLSLPLSTSDPTTGFPVLCRPRALSISPEASRETSALWFRSALAFSHP